MFRTFIMENGPRVEMFRFGIRVGVAPLLMVFTLGPYQSV